MQQLNSFIDELLSARIPLSIWISLGAVFLGLVAVYRILYVLCDLLDMAGKRLLDRLYALCVGLYKRSLPLLSRMLRRATSAARKRLRQGTPSVRENT